MKHALGSNMNGTPGFTCGVVGGGHHAAPHQCHGESVKLPESHSEVGRQGFPLEGVRRQKSSPAAHVQGG